MLGYVRTQSRADIRDRRTYRKVYRELELAVFVGDDLGFTGSKNHIDYTGSRKIIPPLLKLDGGPGAVFAPDDLDVCLWEQRALARPTAGRDHERDGGDGDDTPIAASAASMIR